MEKVGMKQARALWISAMVLLLASGARGNRPGFTYLDHVIDRATFDRIAEELALTEAQMAAAGHDFRQYIVAVQEVERRTAERAAQLIEQRRNLSLPENADAQDEAVADAEFGTALNAAIADGNREADALLGGFYSALAAYLAEEQAARLPAVQRMVRRINALAERPETAMRFSSYVDLIAVVREASQPGGELAPLFARPIVALPADLAQGRAEIGDALERYDLDMDEVLRRYEDARRKVDRETPEEVRIDPQTEAGSRRIRRWGRGWCRKFQIIDGAANAIGAAVRESLGEDPARRWERRYGEAWDPLIWHELPLDGFPPWLAERREHLAPEQIEALEILDAEYLRQRHDLQRRVFEAATDAMCFDYSLRGNEKEHLRYARRILDLLAMHGTTVERMSQVLAPEEGERFKGRFVDPALKGTMSRDLTIHACVVVGLEDPDTFVMYRWDHDSAQYVELRPVLNPETGIWEISSPPRSGSGEDRD